MVHVARRIFGALVVLVIVAGATLALSSRPRLETDRNAVEHAWQAVTPGLGARYVRAEALATAIGGAGGPTDPLVGQVHDAYRTWQSTTRATPVADAITNANLLEGYVRRLLATASGSLLLKGDAAVKAAATALAAVPNPVGVTGLNDAVAKYEKDRGGPLRRLVAGPLGYDSIPRLALASGA